MKMHYTNRYNLPLSMALFLLNDTYDGNSDNPYQISASTLLKSIRKIVLYKRLPDNLITDISDNITSRLGTAYHKAVEDSWLNNPQDSMALLNYPAKMRDNIVVNPSDDYLLNNPNAIPVYLEQRVQRDIGKWTITGQYDLIVNGVLEDIKSTSVFNYLSQNKVEDYTLQGNIYKWLNPEKITEPYMNINYILTDWSAGRARTDKNYPPLKIVIQKLPLSSTDKTEAFIKNKLTQIQLNLNKPEHELPECSDIDLWRRETVYKYFSNPDNKQSTKNFDNLFEASSYAASKGKGVVVTVPGEVTACKYCAAFSICSQKDKYLLSGELKL